jgi:tRNA nucleotidyltransferase/poly(A) polymerase
MIKLANGGKSFLGGLLVAEICLFLRDRSAEVYLVGGYVRDRLLGRVCQDVDFAVKGEAMTLARAVADRWKGAFVPLGKEHDTGRAVLRDEKGQRLFVDFARLRGDSIEADLSLRDFTIDAMAFDPASSRLIDPHQGQRDLQNRVVRAVSQTVFHDDPLRTLRAVRLAVQLDMALEPQTEQWVRRDASLLTSVSAERIRDELSKIVARPGAAYNLRYLDNLGLLTILIPELETTKGVEQPPPHHLNVFEHTLETVGHLEKLAVCLAHEHEIQTETLQVAFCNLHPFSERLLAHLSQPMADGRLRLTLLKIVALLHDLGKPSTASVDENGRLRFFGHEREGAILAGQILSRLRFGAGEVKAARTIIANHMRPPQLAAQETLTRRAVYRFFRDTGQAGVDTLLLYLADHLATWGPTLPPALWRKQVEMTSALLSAYYERHAEAIAPLKLISGYDLIEGFGLEEGPRLGELLETVREAQAAGEVRTREEALQLVEKVLANQSQVPGTSEVPGT